MYDGSNSVYVVSPFSSIIRGVVQAPHFFCL